MLKKIKRLLLIIIIIPFLYGIISIGLSYITINSNEDNTIKNDIFYISTNGVHLNIIIPKNKLNEKLEKGLKSNNQESFISFGWGDRDFYLNTPTWRDLTFKNATKALFYTGSTLIHVTRYNKIQEDWIPINVSENQLKKLNNYIIQSFKYDVNGDVKLLKNKGYGYNDDFYEAIGSYSCLKTCNTWVNSALKESDLKSCLWTPYDFTIINMYK